MITGGTDQMKISIGTPEQCPAAQVLDGAADRRPRPADESAKIVDRRAVGEDGQPPAIASCQAFSASIARPIETDVVAWLTSSPMWRGSG
ncbi:hypothetical protein GCM10027613_30140 [Microlunatus endophyticus]